VRNPSWSADGKTVVYYRFDITNRAQYTRLYSWDRKREYRYTDVFPAICPKSGRLALTDLDFPFGNPTASISVMNVDGTQRKKVFQRQDGASLMPTWSPDCQWVAFGVGTFFGGRGFAPANVFMVKADGSGSRQVTNSGERRFRVASGWQIPHLPRGARRRARDRGLRSLTSPTLGEGARRSGQFPFISLTAPCATRACRTSLDVFTMKPDGSDLKRLTYTSGADAHATWTADGREIWFESSRTGFKDEAALYDTSPQPYAQVFLMDRDGGHVRQLTDSKWEDSMGTYIKGR
jgi:Tol biopolymer transport system component